MHEFQFLVDKADKRTERNGILNFIYVRSRMENPDVGEINSQSQTVSHSFLR